MFSFLTRLPKDIVLHISGYYGKKIPSDLSQEIKDQRFLYSIKETEYYDPVYNTWNTTTLCNVLLDLPIVPLHIKEEYKKTMWKNIDKNIINRIWRLCNSNERHQLIKKHYPYAFFYEPTFITFREFVKSKVGYYVN